MRLLLVALVATAVSLLPPVRVRTVAAATVLEALGWPVLRLGAPPVARSTATVGGVPSVRWGPDHPAPAILLVPGATPQGADDPRVVRLARALARADRVVVIPELELYDEELVRRDVDRLVRVTRALAVDHGPVTLFGISFGGSLCLLAAAEVPGLVRRVVTFGAYADLVGVIQAATTGVSLVGTERIPWDADPRAYGVVRDELLALLDPADAAQVERALGGGPPPTRAVAEAAYELLTNDDPARTPTLAAQLPSSVRTRIDEVSPATAAGALAAVEVVAMHSRDDPVIPYGELRRLAALLPHARTVTVSSFTHADWTPRGWWRTARDLVATWQVATALLG